jgi:hypothetical protein
MTPEDVINNALDLARMPRIGSFYDGTPEAIHALDIYAQNRDLLFYTLEPYWAIDNIPLVLTKSAPNIVNGAANYDSGWSSAYPELPWLYEYLAPGDCIKPLQINRVPMFLPVWRPRTSLFTYMSDADPPVILTNTENATLSYVVRTLDPNLWRKDFTEKLIMALAAQFAPKQPQPQMNQQQRVQDGNNA